MRLSLLCFVFLLSGAAGLIFETLWFRGAGLAFGNSVWASAITLAAYMGGLALGNALAGFLGSRVRQPYRTYARLEWLIAVSGVALVPLLPALGGVLAPWLGVADGNLWWGTPVRLLLAFLLMMVPTTAMGATLPLLVMALHRERIGFGKALGFLYGFNTLGAMAGAILGEAVLIQWFGLNGTGLVAGLLDVAAAQLCIYLMAAPPQGADVSVVGAPAPAPSTARRPLAPRLWLLLLSGGLTGAALLGAEVIWFRFLRLFFLDTDATFVVMLAVILAGIALGGVLAGTMLGRKTQDAQFAGRAAMILAGLCGIAFAASYALFDARVAGSTWYVDQGAIAKLSLLLMFPTAFLSGALFTFLGQSLHALTRTDVEAAAALTTANTAGAMFGALLAAFVLLPVLGLEKAMWTLCAMYCVAFLLLVTALGATRGPLPRVALAGTAVGLVMALALFPFGRMQGHLEMATDKFRSAEASHTVAIREGLTETLQYLRRDWLGQPVSYRLMTNGFSMSDSQPGSRRYMGLYAYWPAALHPALESALLISYGLGNTAKSLTELASLREIQVVDISRDIIHHAEVAYPGDANPLKDPRVQVQIEDGRFYLQAAQRRFDLITSEPPPPRAHGVISLYTEDYFRLIHDRLNEGGWATYWLPVHDMTAADAQAIIKGFCNAFEDCGLWAGHDLNWMLTGSRGARSKPSLEHFTAQWRDPARLAVLQQIGLERPEQLGATFMADAVQLAQLLRDTLPLTDQFPKRYTQGIPVEADQRFYASWMDPGWTLRNFQSSVWVKRFWPAAMREASWNYFLIHQALNTPQSIAERGLRLQMIAEALKPPGLVTPVLWLLGTSQRETEIARDSSDRSVARAYVLGADALAHGNADVATVLFEQALDGGDPRALVPFLFSACRSAQPDKARATAERHGLGNIRNSLAHCW